LPTSSFADFAAPGYKPLSLDRTPPVVSDRDAAGNAEFTGSSSATGVRMIIGIFQAPAGPGPAGVILITRERAPKAPWFAEEKQMEDDVIDISQLKTGQKFTLDMGIREVAFTKLDEPKKFAMEDWFEHTVDIYIMEDKIEEDEPLHYAYQPMSLSEGMERNKGKFGKNMVMWDFIGRVVEGIEMEEEEEAEA